MTTIMSVYVEQLQTTFETMRRRGLVVYDAAAHAIAYFDKMRKKLPKEIKNLLKNDTLKSVYSDVFDKKSLDANNRNRRIALQELYFGIAVIVMGMCAGEMTGVLWSASILSAVFDPIIEMVLVVLMPIYTYLHLKNGAAYDAIDRRAWLFAVVFATCVPIGNLFGARLLTTNLSLFFVPPLIIALLIDVELSPITLYKTRKAFLAAVVGASLVCWQSLALIFGTASVAGLIVSALHGALIAVHFQVMEPRIDDGRIGKNEAQLLYVIGAFLIHVPVALIFGSLK